ncbi:MAG: hypothetical protein M1570_18025 [Chloroflexi bacterium]|nr:hypothetical protein [Chloroflexota bacterium]
MAPIGSLFYRAHFVIPTVSEAARAKHARARPAVSLTHFLDTGLAIIVHGHATVMTPQDAHFAELEQLQREVSGQSVREWGDGEGVYLRVSADMMFTYAREPDKYPG